MPAHPADELARQTLASAATRCGLDVRGGGLRRTSSRFCLGVEHGDYNGTELFGVGTDRFLWIAWKGNSTGRVRLFSANFPADGIVEFAPGRAPEPGSPVLAGSWGRFACGADWVLHRHGHATSRGLDAVVFGNIPGGGMSRSASLALNLILTFAEGNRLSLPQGMPIVDLARAIETDYVGSPCGELDQVMIYFARAGMGTHFRPQSRTVEHVPLGAAAADLRFVSLDTGTVRHGLETSTYSHRRRECEECIARGQPIAPIRSLAEIDTPEKFAAVDALLRPTHPHLADRAAYIHRAQQRFPRLLSAWRAGDMTSLGALFRADGHDLRDLYRISGPELETMCDIARTVPAVLGERMLGGGDKGAAGALVPAGGVEALQAAVALAYPRCHPAFADRFAVHVCAAVDGITVLPGL